MRFLQQHQNNQDHGPRIFDNDDDEEAFIFLMMMFCIANQVIFREEPFVFSRNRHVFHRALDAHQRQIRERRIPWEALVPPSECAWRRLYESGNKQALITFTGLDHATFAMLLSLFRPYYMAFTPHVDMKYLHRVARTGRRRLHSASDVLGLNLAYTRTRGSFISLQMAFGMTMTNVYRWLHFGRRVIILGLRNHPDARIAIPWLEKIEEYKEAVAARHDLLTDVWCCLDGLQMGCQAPLDPTLQQIFYNNWKADHFVKGVFVFVPDGRVVISYFNVPGNVHDSQIAYLGRIYDKLEGVFFNCGGQCVGDSAFAHTQKEFIIRSGKFIRGLELHHEINRLIGNGDWEAVHQVAENVQATSMRQASEWGMRALKASFPRLVDTIFYEDYGERKHIMKMAILLYNL